MAPTTHRNYSPLATRCIYRRAILPSRIGEVWSTLVRDARRGSITFLQVGGRKVVANMWRLRVVFVRTFRAFLEYILPAGGSSAINITRDSNPLPSRDEGGKDDGGGSGERVIVFPVSPFSVLHPFTVFPPCAPFFDGRLTPSRIYLSLSILAKLVYIFCWKRLKWAISLSLLALKISAIRNR